jgi:hypothetical protein
MTKLSEGALRDKIAGLEKTLAKAERDLGAAVLAGKPVEMLRNLAQDARDGIAACELAIKQLRSEEAQEAERAREAAASAERLKSYEWAAEYAGLQGAVLEAEAALRAADAELRAHFTKPEARRIVRIGRTFRHEEAELCAGVTRLVTQPGELWIGRQNPRTGALQPGDVAPEYQLAKLLSGLGAVDRVNALRERAESRADEERRGDGRDWSGEPAPGVREAQEERRRQRAEAKAQRERERAEAAAAAGAAEERPRQPPRGRAFLIAQQEAN